jgi:hypothetical protein
MTDSTMVKKVAAAIRAKVPYGYGMTDAETVEYARAAIEALMEPTPALLAAQTNTDPDIARVVHGNRTKLYSDPF